MTSLNSSHPFNALTPDMVLDAIESTGLQCDGRMLALNSYENRVYQVGLDDSDPIIVKFYRPGRWTRDQILEEHSFVAELQGDNLSVVAPMANKQGSTIYTYAHFDFAIYPRKGGQAPELNHQTLYSLGTYMGILHSIGSIKPFRFRRTLSPETFGHPSRAFLLENDFIPGELRAAYETLSADLLTKVDDIFKNYTQLKNIRLHGDCHTGNILWRDDKAHFVDFDDCMSGPAIQDLWMLLSGSRDQQLAQLSELIEGYETFYHFNTAELGLIEALRTLRLMHYSAWLARRWDDPAFPHSFPWFNTVRYWSSHVLELREQMSALDEPALTLY